MQLREIQRRPELHRLLGALAARMATLLKIETIASELTTPKTTIERYKALLEEVFLIKRIPAWSNSMTKRALQMQKIPVVDSGLGASLAGMTIDRVRRQDAIAGPLLENFAIGEITRQLSWAVTPARLCHYRNSDGQEVDVVFEEPVELFAVDSMGSFDFAVQPPCRRPDVDVLDAFVEDVPVERGLEL
jgi:uncharacterized protein